jgi:hypothetical protein
VKKPQKTETHPYRVPAGFDLVEGTDNGPYILITRRTTRSRGVHHPAPLQSREVTQAALGALAERVVMLDARNELRKAERAIDVAAIMEEEGVEEAEALALWKERRNAAEIPQPGVTFRQKGGTRG